MRQSECANLPEAIYGIAKLHICQMVYVVFQTLDSDMKLSQESFFAHSLRWFLVLAWAQVPSRAHADILQYACGM
jgi:hypothetical protein